MVRASTVWVQFQDQWFQLSQVWHTKKETHIGFLASFFAYQLFPGIGINDQQAA